MAAGDANQVVELDSNFLVAVLDAGSSQSEMFHTWTHQGVRIQISAIAWSEYLCGPLDAAVVPLARKLVNSVEAFTERDAELASELFDGTGRRSRSHVDCMIAAHAIRRGAALATSNIRDFRPFERFALKLAKPLRR
jgi:predicted nucleic acid-binding protein